MLDYPSGEKDPHEATLPQFLKKRCLAVDAALTFPPEPL